MSRLTNPSNPFQLSLDFLSIVKNTLLYLKYSATWIYRYAFKQAHPILFLREYLPPFYLRTAKSNQFYQLGLYRWPQLALNSLRFFSLPNKQEWCQFLHKPSIRDRIDISWSPISVLNNSPSPSRSIFQVLSLSSPSCPTKTNYLSHLITGICSSHGVSSPPSGKLGCTFGR